MLLLFLYSVYRTTHSGTKDQQIKMYSNCENRRAGGTMSTGRTSPVGKTNPPVDTFSEILTHGLEQILPGCVNYSPLS